MTGSITVIGSNNFPGSFNAEIQLVITSWHEKFVLIFDPYCNKNKVSAIGMNDRSVGCQRQRRSFFSSTYDILSPFCPVLISNYFKFTGLINNTIPFQAVFKFPFFLFAQRFTI